MEATTPAAVAAANDGSDSDSDFDNAVVLVVDAADDDDDVAGQFGSQAAAAVGKASAVGSGPPAGGDAKPGGGVSGGGGVALSGGVPAPPSQKLSQWDDSWHISAGLPPGAHTTLYDVNIEEYADKNWRHLADVSEFFNYGLTEKKWLVRADRCSRLGVRARVLRGWGEGRWERSDFRF